MSRRRTSGYFTPYLTDNLDADVLNAPRGQQFLASFIGALPDALCDLRRSGLSGRETVGDDLRVRMAVKVSIVVVAFHGAILQYNPGLIKVRPRTVHSH